MSNIAPVCELTPQIITTQPDAKEFPFIPPATDLASALAAINAMRQGLMLLYGHSPAVNGTSSRAPTPGGFTVKPSPSNKVARYQEVLTSRVTTRAVVHSSEDPSTTLTFKRIDKLLFKDTKTGELIPWDRHADNN